MLEWKQVDSLPYSIPCDWRPRLKLEKAVGCRLFRLRLSARQSGEDLVVRVKKGNFKALRIHNLDYQALVPIADNLVAIATALRMTPISEQRKIKSQMHEGWSGPNWVEDLSFYAPPAAQLAELYRQWTTYISPWSAAGWVTSGPDSMNVTITAEGDAIVTDQTISGPASVQISGSAGETSPNPPVQEPQQ